MSRVLFAGDTHGNMSHLRYLVKVAEENHVQRIFVLGDFGYWEHMREGVEFLDKLSVLATERGTRVYFLDGNHDNLDLLINRYSGAEYMDLEGFVWIRPNVIYAPRGHRWTWDGVRFIALGGAYSVDKEYRLALERKGKRKAGTLWFPGEEMTDRDMLQILDDTTSVDVILAHDKPYSTEVDFNTKTVVESLHNQHRLQAAMETLRPLMFLHGHLHTRYTQQVRMNSLLDMAECTVEGLAADPEASWRPRYKAKDSWIIVDLEEVASVRR